MSASIKGVAVSLSTHSKTIAKATVTTTTVTISSAITAFKAAQAAGTLANFSPVTIKDASSAITSGINLSDLSTMALAGKIAGISFTDKTASLTVDRSVATGDLSDPKSTNGTDLVLQSITSAFKLNLTNVSVADASTIKSPSKNATLQISVVDTAATISAGLDKLETLAKAKALQDITITDANSALFNVSETALKADADAIKVIQGNYKLEATAVLAADVTKLAATKNLVGIDVVDSSKNVLANASALNTSAATAQLMSVTLTDTTNPTVSISDAVTLNSLPSLSLPKGVKLNIADTANNIIDHARFDIGNIIANAGSIILTDKTTPILTLADAKTLTGLSNLASGTKYAIADGGSAIIAQAKVINEKAVSGASNVQIVKSLSIADAKTLTGIKALDKTTQYSITDSVTNLLAQSAVKGDTILSKAVTVNITDTSANVLANLDKLETLAKAGSIDNISISDANTTGYIALPSEKILVDQDAVGKILAQIVITPPSSSTISAVTAPFTGTNSGSNAYYLMPRAARSSGELVWATENINVSSKPGWNNPAINTFGVTLTAQNAIGTLEYTPFYNGGTINLQGIPGNAVLPVLFKTDSPTQISTGGLIKFNQISASNGINTYNVTFNAISVTNSNAPTAPLTPSQMTTTVSPTATILLSSLTLDSNKGESYSWSNDENGIIIVWNKQSSVAADGTSSYDINVAKFDVSGKQVGSTTVLSNAFSLSANDLANGNAYRFDTIDNNHLLVGDRSGGVKIVTINTGISTPSFAPDLDAGSFGVIGNYSNPINPDSTGTNHSLVLQYSGTKNGQNVVEYYSVDMATMKLIGQSGPIATNLPVTNLRGGLTLPDGSTSIFGYQDGTSLHTQMIDGMGHLVNEIKTTLPSGVKFDRYKPLSDGQFEAVWRQPNGTSGGNEIIGQIFDTRGAAISKIGSGSQATIFAGTSNNDTITAVTNGSIIEGRTGGDTLTATARAYNSTLSYEHSSGGVIVDLSKNAASGGDATGDKISGFTNLIGSNSNDTLTGKANGYVYGGGGNDILIGDGKTTTALYTGNFSDYNISNDALGRLVIADIRTGSPDGTDTLINIAQVKFADGLYQAMKPPINFADPASYSVGRNARNIVSADLNNDGNLDLILPSADTDTLTILSGKADGTFQSAKSVPVGRQPYTVMAQDLNGDGNIDIVTSDHTGGDIAVLINDGKGNFTKTQYTTLNDSKGSAPNGLSIGDYNGDGIKDIFVAYDNGSIGASVFLGSKDGTFNKRVDGVSVPTSKFDLNGDGINDKISMPDSASSGYSIYLGNKDGSFTLTQTVQRNGPGQYNLYSLSDINNDGVPDLLTYSSGDNSLSIYTGKGDGTFSQPATLTNSTQSVWGNVVGDFNHDGIPDIAMNLLDQSKVNVYIQRPSKISLTKIS